MNSNTLQQKYLIVPWVSIEQKTKTKQSDAWKKQAKLLRGKITQAWQGENAVKEIRNQRTKSY